MQFIEKNSFNVRSTIYRLKRDGDDFEFLLFPMIHIGSKEYYREVRQRMAKCDLLLFEGVKSKRADFLTLSYRIVRKMKRMDLVTQREALKLGEINTSSINTDMGGHEFDSLWSSIPISLKIQFAVIIPFLVVYLYLSGTREFLAEHIAVDDLPSRDETLNFDEQFENLIDY
jgi:hypothetical protein